MAELAALNVKITGDASGIKAAANSATKSVQNFSKSAESSAKVFERAFSQNERSVDRLRRSIDPLYAASKRYETAVNTLDKALKAGSISQATHTRLLSQAGTAYLTAGGQAARAATQTAQMSGAFGLLGNMSRSTGARMQQVGFQLQDVAIQLQAGTRASVVFAQQGSQIASVFGPVGAIIGTLAAVGIPLLAFAFSNATEKTRSFDDAVADLEGSITRLQNAAAAYSSKGIQGMVEKYGELNAEILRSIELERQAATERAARDTAETIRAFAAEIGSAATMTANLAREFDITRERAADLGSAINRAVNAKNYDDQIFALTVVRDQILDITGGVKNMTEAQFAHFEQINRAIDALRQLKAEEPGADWLSAGIAAAQTLGNKLWDAAAAAAKVRQEQSEAAKGALQYSGRGADPRQFTEGGVNSFGGSIYGTGATGASGRGGGGGGGGTNPIVSQLESLRQSLMTQEEAQIASFARQQETLTAALEQRRITQEEYQALLERSQQMHSERMASIDAYRYGDQLQQAGAFFGDMASALQGGNEKMIAIGKKFAAAEALINAWRAYAQTIADPSLPFFAKFAAAAKVLAAGMGAVSAIRGAGGGGGASSSTGAANANAAPTPLEVRLNGVNPSSLYSGADIGSLLDRLGEEAGDRGYRLMISR